MFLVDAPDKVNVGRGFCLMVIVRELASGAVNRTVPVLWLVFGFAVKWILNGTEPWRVKAVVLLDEPGVDNLSQLLVVRAVHAVLDKTVTVVWFAV